MPEAEAEQIEAQFEKGGPLRKVLVAVKTLGPGVVTGASDDDPATIGTFAQTGAQFGYAQLWVLLFTFPMMVVVQEMCARIGLQTGSGLARVIRRHYPRPILYFCIILLLAANTINVGADLGVMAASGQLILGLPFIVWLLLITAVSAGLEIFLDYKQYSRVLRFFTFALFSYVLVVFVVPQDWGAALRSTIIPTFKLNPNFLMNLVALIGTAISPYLYFWQTSEEVEEKIEKGEVTKELDEGKVVEEGKPGVSRTELKWMRTDVAAGMFLANVVGWFMIVTTASTLGRHGIHNINSATQVAQSLQPLAGNFAYLLFAFGIIGTGMLSVPVLAGSIAYAVSETFNVNEGLYQKAFDAPGFYAVIAFCTIVGAAMNFIGINPIQAL